MTEVNTCPGCGQPNQCASSKGEPPESCWCMKPLQSEDKLEAPVLLPVPKAVTSCYCERCLEKIQKESGRAQNSTG
ncbi:cysteine-rich CWC family protein [Endozoicomonas atrinae]|uniref:cysteine-rich CWC family protein n=1 Tax=Endozoicomonas atrinae TaxID=1333660 RepID=UPI003B00A128